MTWTLILVDRLQTLHQREYRTRILIIQEFVFAPEVELWLEDDVKDENLASITQIVESATQYEPKRDLLEEDIERHVSDLQISPGILVMEHRNRRLWNRMDETTTIDGEVMDVIVEKFIDQGCSTPEVAFTACYHL